MVDYRNGHFKPNDFDRYVRKLAVKCSFECAKKYFFDNGALMTLYFYQNCIDTEHKYVEHLLSTF